MGAYIFRFPAEMPKLTFDGLKSLPEYGSGLRVWRRIGATVTIHHEEATATAPARYRLMLYRTVLAWIGEREVHFARHGDTHQATRMWLQQIVQDNGIGNIVSRDKGVLEIDFTRPLEGHTFPVREPSV